MLSTAKKRLKILKDMKGWWDLNECNKKYYITTKNVKKRLLIMRGTTCEYRG